MDGEIPKPGFVKGSNRNSKAFGEFTELGRRRFEDDVVNVLLRRYRLDRFRPELRAVAKEKDDSSLMTLDDFREVFSEFPVHLEAQLVKKVVELSPVHVLLSRFYNAPFFAAFEQVEAVAEQQRSCRLPVLAFRWSTLRAKDSGSIVVVHSVPDLSHVGGARITWVNPETHQVYVLEQLSSFLDSLDAHSITWSMAYGDDDTGE